MAGTAYYADTVNDAQVFIPGIIGAFMRPFSFNMTNTSANTGFTVNDTVALCPIPYKSGSRPGVLVIGYRVNVPALDSSTAIRVQLGDNNGTTGAFQATYYSAQPFGQSSLGATIGDQVAFNGTTTTPVLPSAMGATGSTANMPRQYTSFTGTSTSTPYGDLQFILKISTAATTATTTGLITGYLLMQPIQSTAASWLQGSTA